MADLEKRRGRPTSFNRERALDAAAAVFWRHGYEGASLSMLTTALGCTSPTLYAAFGSKEGLYRKALAAYRRNDDITPGRAPDDLEPYEMVERYLRTAASEFVNNGHPCGCMVAVGSLQTAPGNETAAAAAAAAREESLNAFVARIERANREGHFANPVNARSIAHFYTAVVQGMAVQAIDGASQDQLNLIVDMALAAWPALTPSSIRA